MTEFINLTPHAINVEGLGVLPPSGTVARVATIREGLRPVGGVRLIRQAFGEVEGIPEPTLENKLYVVSALVLSALNGTRIDVVAPDTGPDAIRENGQIVAVRGFVC